MNRTKTSRPTMADQMEQPVEPLLPCPFCGNEAHLVDDLITVHAECSSCGASGAASSYTGGATKAWNRRA